MSIRKNRLGVFCVGTHLYTQLTSLAKEKHNMATLEASGESTASDYNNTESISDSSTSIHNTIKDLSDFKLKNILQNNSNRKSVYLCGTFDSREGDAVVILEKTAFAEENLNNDSDYFTDKSYLEKIFQNDIYGDYKYFTLNELNCMYTYC